MGFWSSLSTGACKVLPVFSSVMSVVTLGVDQVNLYKEIAALPDPPACVQTVEAQADYLTSVNDIFEKYGMSYEDMGEELLQQKQEEEIQRREEESKALNAERYRTEQHPPDNDDDLPEYKDYGAFEYPPDEEEKDRNENNRKDENEDTDKDEDTEKGKDTEETGKTEKTEEKGKDGDGGNDGNDGNDDHTEDNDGNGDHNDNNDRNNDEDEGYDGGDDGNRHDDDNNNDGGGGSGDKPIPPDEEEDDLTQEQKPLEPRKLPESDDDDDFERNVPAVCAAQDPDETKNENRDSPSNADPLGERNDDKDFEYAPNAQTTEAPGQKDELPCDTPPSDKPRDSGDSKNVETEGIQ